jgi:hypothetical protein
VKNSVLSLSLSPQLDNELIKRQKANWKHVLNYPIILLVMQAVEFLPFIGISDHTYCTIYGVLFNALKRLFVRYKQDSMIFVSSTDMDHIHLGVIPSKITREDMPYSAQSMNLTNLTQKKQML